MRVLLLLCELLAVELTCALETSVKKAVQEMRSCVGVVSLTLRTWCPCQWRSGARVRAARLALELRADQAFSSLCSKQV